MPTAPTVTTLPETKGPALCLRLSGEVTAQDLTDYCITPLEKILAEYGYYNLYVHYDPAFRGWTPEAADLSFRSVSTFTPKAKRLAYVNAPDSRMLMMKMLEPITDAEIRYFDDDRQKDAMEWVLDCKADTAD